MRKVLLPLLFIVVTISCNTAKHPGKAMKNLSFLNGYWQFNEQGIQMVEDWKSSSESLNGTSLLILKGDTVFQENIVVKEINGKITYKSTMGKYVVEDLKTLPLSFCTHKKAVFGNANQTNSTYISYTFRRGKLILEMRDVVNGKVIHDKYGLEKAK
jgi:hypothetical protein